MIGMDPHVNHHFRKPPCIVRETSANVFCIWWDFSDSPPFADGEALTNQGFSPILSSALGEAAHVWKGTEIQVENWDYGQLIGFIAGLRAPSSDNMTAGWCFGTCFPYIGKIFIPTDELIFFRGVAKNHQPGWDSKNGFRSRSQTEPALPELFSRPGDCGLWRRNCRLTAAIAAMARTSISQLLPSFLESKPGFDLPNQPSNLNRRSCSNHPPNQSSPNPIWS